jgi:hypothetical protein
MLRSLATLALLIPLAFAPDAAAATGTTHGKAPLTQSDGKKKTAKKHKRHPTHKRHHKKKRTAPKKNSGVRN